MKQIARWIYNIAMLLFRALKLIYWKILNIAYKLRILSIYNIPIFVNNFNRLTHTRQLIEFLERCGFRKIIIIDNNSSYLPLLTYYEKCRHKVIKSAFNYGHLAFWKSGLYRKYKWNYFVYTDSDVVPIDECPDNFIEYFKIILDSNNKLDKLGFGIKIDDLPDCFTLKNKVVDYEKRYWQKEVQPNIYEAPVDTTFALYKPLSNLKNGEVYTLAAYRTGFPYLIRHLPWYVDSKNLSEEELFYIQTSNRSSSLSSQNKGHGVY